MKRFLLFLAGIILILSGFAFAITWNSTAYTYAQQIYVLNNNGTLSLDGNYTSNMSSNPVDTATLISAGKMQSDCSDLAIYSNASAKDINRVVYGCNTAFTNVTWKVQTAISGSANSSDFILEYGKNGTVYPLNDEQYVDLVFDNFESGSLNASKFVCSDTCVVSNGVLKITTSTLSSLLNFSVLSDNLLHYKLEATLNASGGGASNKNFGFSDSVPAGLTNYTFFGKNNCGGTSENLNSAGANQSRVCDYWAGQTMNSTVMNYSVYLNGSNATAVNRYTGNSTTLGDFGSKNSSDMGIYVQGDNVVNVDDLRLQEYIYPEPTFSRDAEVKSNNIDNAPTFNSQSFNVTNSSVFNPSTTILFLSNFSDDFNVINCTLNIDNLQLNMSYYNGSATSRYFNVNTTLSAGTHNYYYQAFDNTSGTNQNTISQNFTLVLNRSQVSITEQLNGSASNLALVFPQTANATAWANVSGLTLLLLENNSGIANATVPTSINVSRKVSDYNFTACFQGNQNYSSACSLQLFANITKGSINLTLQLNGTNNNISYTLNDTINASGWSNVSSLALNLLRNGTAIADTSTPSILNTSLTQQTFNFSLYFGGNENYSTKIQTFFANVTSGNQPPTFQSQSFNITNSSTFVQSNTLFLANFIDDYIMANASICINNSPCANMSYYNGSATNRWLNYNTSLGAGTYNYYYSAFDNSSLNTNSTNFTLVILVATSTETLFLNGSSSDMNYNGGETINASAIKSISESNLTLYRNGTSIAFGTNFVQEKNQSASSGVTINYTACFSASQNYSSSCTQFLATGLVPQPTPGTGGYTGGQPPTPTPQPSACNPYFSLKFNDDIPINLNSGENTSFTGIIQTNTTCSYLENLTTYTDCQNISLSPSSFDLSTQKIITGNVLASSDCIFFVNEGQKTISAGQFLLNTPASEKTNYDQYILYGQIAIFLILIVYFLWNKKYAVALVLLLLGCLISYFLVPTDATYTQNIGSIDINENGFNGNIVKDVYLQSGVTTKILVSYENHLSGYYRVLTTSGTSITPTKSSFLVQPATSGVLDFYYASPKASGDYLETIVFSFYNPDGSKNNDLTFNYNFHVQQSDLISNILNTRGFSRITSGLVG